MNTQQFSTYQDYLSNSPTSSIDKFMEHSGLILHANELRRGGRKQVKIGTNKRNARERNRVRYINNCFDVLRDILPSTLNQEVPNETAHQRKLSKVETLKQAIDYIKLLTNILQQDQQNDSNESYENTSSPHSSSCESQYSYYSQYSPSNNQLYQQQYYFFN